MVAPGHGDVWVQPGATMASGFSDMITPLYGEILWLLDMGYGGSRAWGCCGSLVWNMVAPGHGDVWLLGTTWGYDGFWVQRYDNSFVWGNIVAPGYGIWWLLGLGMWWPWVWDVVAPGHGDIVASWYGLWWFLGMGYGGSLL